MMTVDEALKISDVSCATGSYPNVLAAEARRQREEIKALNHDRDAWKASAEAAKAEIDGLYAKYGVLQQAHQGLIDRYVNIDHSGDAADMVKPSLYVSFSECGQFIRFWTRSKMDMQAQRLDTPDMQITEFYASSVPASPAVAVPAVSEPNPVQWLEDEGDMILVPRGLLGAACSAIENHRKAEKVLDAMRYYTMNAPQAPTVADCCVSQDDAAPVPAVAVPAIDIETTLDASTATMCQCLRSRLLASEVRRLRALLQSAPQPTNGDAK